VQLAAAVGQPDAYAGELPVAYVQLRPGAAVDAAALLAFVEPRIPERPALPKRIEIVAAMPLTAIGKVYKPALRVRATQHAFDAALAPMRARGWSAGVQAVERDGGVVVSVRVDGPSGSPEQGAAVDEVDAMLRACLRDFSVGWSRVD
jgi:fatty-acyl-CoA synthase